MSWNAPNAPVSGTTITVAWAVTNLVNNLSWLRALTGNADPPAADRIVRSTSTTGSVWGQVNTGCIEDSAVTGAKIAGDTITENKIVTGTIIESKLNSAVTAKLVPSGLGGFFATAAGIASGWSRYTAADGRALIGAGTTFSQTFTENTPVGASWTPMSGLSIAATTGAASVANAREGTGANIVTPDHSHTIASSGTSTAWIPPARVVVWATKN